MVNPYGVRRWLANALFVTMLWIPMADAKTVRILILGDSLTAGFGLPAAEGFQAVLQTALRARGHDVTLLDAAVSGDTTAGGRARLEWALADGADAAFVELGANDLLRGLPPAAMQANLTAILDTLERKRIPTLLSGMLSAPNLGADYATQYNAVFDVLSHRPGLLFDRFFLEGIAGERALNQADGIHPNAAGVKQEVARLVPLFERLIGEVK